MVTTFAELEAVIEKAARELFGDDAPPVSEIHGLTLIENKLLPEGMWTACHRDGSVVVGYPDGKIITLPIQNPLFKLMRGGSEPERSHKPF